MVEKTYKKIVLKSQTPVVFDRDGNIENFSNNKTVLLVPENLFEVPDSLQKLEKVPYRIGRNFNEKILAEKSNAVVYAPFPLGFWGIHALSKEHFDKVILDKPDHYRFSKNFFFRLILKNERRRMGSDVFSPFMMRKLRNVLSVADYFSLTIGDWLYLTKDTLQQIGRFSKNIYWLDQKTEPQKIMSFIRSPKR